MVMVMEVWKNNVISTFQPGELDDVMQSALLANRVDFVKLFMENGVSLKDFLTVRRLLSIYNNVSFFLFVPFYLK